MFQPEEVNDTSCESLARRLFLANFSGNIDDTSIGDALRGSLNDLVSYVVQELGGKLEGFEWDEQEGIKDWPYTSEAILQVEAITQ